MDSGIIGGSRPFEVPKIQRPLGNATAARIGCVRGVDKHSSFDRLRTPAVIDFNSPYMGRYDFRPLRVHRTASQLLAAERIKHVPPWHEVIGTVPPAQTLVRSQPLQHQEKPRRPNIKKPSKMFQPQRIVYEEDTLRKEFFADHPWELARPRVVLENDGRDAERRDWSLVSQPGRPVDGER